LIDGVETIRTEPQSRESCMNVRVRVLFLGPPAREDWNAMRSMADDLTNDRQGIRVFVDPEEADWLVAEFTMPTDAQIRAVDRIDWVMKFYAHNYNDSVIQFPKTDAERARADRKNERNKARRIQKRQLRQESNGEAR
jgi:hypothetical protein